MAVWMVYKMDFQKVVQLEYWKVEKWAEQKVGPMVEC
jgi:hypothetical protein